MGKDANPTPCIINTNKYKKLENKKYEQKDGSQPLCFAGIFHQYGSD